MYGSTRDDYVLRVQANEVCAILVQGLGCRLGRCFCALHRGVHRTPTPFSRNQIKEKVFHTEYLFFFLLFVQEGLEPTASEGMSPSGLMTRSFKCSRRRWAMKRVPEKAKTRSIGVRQCPRRLCFAGASKRSLRDIGSRSRLPPRSVLQVLPPPVADEGSA